MPANDTHQHLGAKLHPEIKAKWLQYLRSGMFIQGHGALRHPASSRCCLGVLCNIAEEDGIGHWDPDDPETFIPQNGSWENCVLPRSVSEWAFQEQSDGDNENPWVMAEDNRGNVAAVMLSELNDGSEEFRPRTFSEIANIIEEQL